MDLSAAGPTREQCAEQGLCFYCKRPGHVKSQCAERRLNEAHRNGQRAPATDLRAAGWAEVPAAVQPAEALEGPKKD